MNKRTIAALIIIILLCIFGGLYWLGYLSFHNYVPSFTTNPGESQSNTTSENKEIPKLSIESIHGKINKISAVIKNVGEGDANTVNWSISVTGGILKRIDMKTSGTISTLSTGSETTVLTGRVPWGIGRLQITVTVDCPGSEPVTQTARGFKFLFFVVGVRT